MNESDFPKDIVKAAGDYSGLMNEVKGRVDVLREMLTPAFFSQWPSPVALECCYLQLRMITEAVALACLTAHGTAPGTRQQWIRKEVSADAIMNALSDLHPDFYPIPEQQMRNEDGSWKGHKILDGGFIKRRELTALYSKCGRHLHIGSYDQRRKRKPIDEDTHIKLLIETMRGIVNLLRWHTIVMTDPKFQLWVEMSPPNKEDVSVRLIQIEDHPPEFFELLAKNRSAVDRHG